MNFKAKAFGFLQALGLVKGVRDDLDARQMAWQEAERLRAIILEELKDQAPATTTFGTWPKLKPLTKTEREIEGYGGTKMLIRSGDLFNAVSTIQTSKGAWVGVKKKSKRARKRGVRRASAKKVSKGGKRDTRRVPRQDTELSEEERKKKKKAAERRKLARKLKKEAGLLVKAKPGENLANIASVHEFGYGPIAIKMTPAMRRFLFGVLFKKAGVGSAESGGKSGFVTYSIPARPFLRPAAEHWENTLEESVKIQIRTLLKRR